MRPRRWIDPSQDRPLPGQLRIVRLASGQLRATVWRAYNPPPHDPWPGCYADRNGDGVDDVVAVGVTWSTRHPGASGRNVVPERKLRVPDVLWDRFSARVAASGSNRNSVINELIAEYCARPR